jgi:hypothetical protein
MRDVARMRTTVNIDEDVLRAVKELARLGGRSIGEVLSELARETLRRDRPTPDTPLRNGVPLLPDRPGAGLVTPDLVTRFGEAYREDDP